jgi:lathosterol oxidase
MDLSLAFVQVLNFLLIKFAILFVLPYFIFWKWFPSSFKHFKIQNPERQKPQLKTEITYSLVTIFIQALIFLSILYGNQKGVFHLYWGFGSEGYAKEFWAFIAYVIFYDAYFYWSHRLLHIGWFYKNVHVIHHKSLNPTPFASFSFHPIEGLINLLYFFPIVLLFSMSFEIAIFLLVLTDISNLMGHLGYDLVPRDSRTKWWGSWLTTPTHHNMHHQFSRSNFGLYWNGWDQYFKTMHPRTEQEFYRVKDQAKT